MGKMDKILFEEQQESFPTLEDPKREEVDAKELDEILGKKRSQLLKNRKI